MGRYARARTDSFGNPLRRGDLSPWDIFQEPISTRPVVSIPWDGTKSVKYLGQLLSNNDYNLLARWMIDRGILANMEVCYGYRDGYRIISVKINDKVTAQYAEKDGFIFEREVR